MSKVLVITTSLRAKSNSDILAARLIDGAKDAGHEVEVISLKGKTIRYCIGCLACQKTQKCIQQDDAIEISEKVKNADTLVFVTPIYYYEMSGQMKALLDRMNPLYPSDYRFRKVYISCPHFGNALYQIMGWNPDYVYRIRGSWAARGRDEIIVFPLTNAMPASQIIQGAGSSS